MLDKGVILVMGRMEQDGMGFHPIIQNITQLESYEFFISRMFHLIF